MNGLNNSIHRRSSSAQTASFVHSPIQSNRGILPGVNGVFCPQVASIGWQKCIPLFERFFDNRFYQPSVFPKIFLKSGIYICKTGFNYSKAVFMPTPLK